MASANKVEKSNNNVKFAKGGDTPMFGEQQAEPQTPKQTASESDPGPGAKFAKGGGGKMFGFSPALPQQAGRTSAR